MQSADGMGPLCLYQTGGTIFFADFAPFFIAADTAWLVMEKIRKFTRKKSFFLKSFQENMIKSEENARRSGLKRRKTGPFYFADFSPFQFAGDNFWELHPVSWGGEQAEKRPRNTLSHRHLHRKQKTRRIGGLGGLKIGMVEQISANR